VTNSCDTNICGGGGAKYYVGDLGTEIIVDTCSDISEATLAALIVLKPNASTPVTWVGAVYETTKIRYIVTADDFNVAGEYRLQAYVEMPGWKGRGDTVRFKVTDPFQ
jgi:hypothetical protein